MKNLKLLKTAEHRFKQLSVSLDLTFKQRKAVLLALTHENDNLTQQQEAQNIASLATTGIVARSSTRVITDHQVQEKAVASTKSQQKT